jgi:hypothetical protein
VKKPLTEHERTRLLRLGAELRAAEGAA